MLTNDTLHNIEIALIAMTLSSQAAALQRKETNKMATTEVEVNVGMNFDVVAHPSHYCEGRKYEPRKVIEDWNLDFYLGNALKYISRAGRKKDAVEDLKKAKQYIDFEIERLVKVTKSKNENSVTADQIDWEKSINV